MNSVQPQIAAKCYCVMPNKIRPSQIRPILKTKILAKSYKLSKKFLVFNGEIRTFEYVAIKFIYEKHNTFRPLSDKCKCDRDCTMVATFLSSVSPKFLQQKPKWWLGSKFKTLMKPTTGLSSLVIFMIVYYRWNIYQLDAENTFLYGDISKTVHMQQSPRSES